MRILKQETITRYRDDKGHWAKAPDYKARNAHGPIDHKDDNSVPWFGIVLVWACIAGLIIYAWHKAGLGWL